MQAVRAGNLEGVEALLKKGADCNVEFKGKRLLEMATESKKFLILEALLNLRADTNFFLESGDTLLHLAARSGHAETVQVFLNYGIR
ncbi:ankyrin repeat domain-containing protein, partial [Klebsiella pneumoniae]